MDHDSVDIGDPCERVLDCSHRSLMLADQTAGMLLVCYKYKSHFVRFDLFAYMKVNVCALKSLMAG